MLPEDITTEIKAILEIDVSWKPHDHYFDDVPWTAETEKPAPWDMGIDDLGDAMDYIEGVRGRLIKLVKRLSTEPVSTTKLLCPCHGNCLEPDLCGCPHTGMVMLSGHPLWDSE